MKPKLTEHAARLAQIKIGLDRISEGHYSHLPATDDRELKDLFKAFDRMSRVVEEREGYLRDQNVQLAASVSRIEKLLDASIDGIAFVSHDGVLKFVNRRFCEILGLQVGSLNKKTVAEAEALWNASVQNPLRIRSVLSPAPHDNKDGALDVVDGVVELVGAEPRYAQVYGAPILDDDGVFAGRIISLHDNTREMELDRLKTEFISVVSHELRTPLTSIKGYTDLLLSGATGEINEIQREFLGILQSSANRLGNLINDILDLSRIDAGRVQVKQEAVDYTKIVGDHLRLMKAFADEKEISLDVSYPQNLPTVAGDSDKISQVVANLLSNAIKYTPAGGWIKVSIEVTGDATVRTCVADSGIGISAADQKRLFQKFFRADNSLTREAGGTGLGLVIVKSIIEMLGGSIWVQSETGRGSKFFFTLPLLVERKHGEPAKLSAEQPVEVPDRGVALVLVIDNSSLARETLQHSLHRRGFGVITAGSSDEALQKARQHKPDVILIDIMMDDCLGYCTLTSLRADPASASLPVIAFSMLGDGSDDKVALGAIGLGSWPNIQKSLTESIGHRRQVGGRLPYVLIATFGPDQTRRAQSASATLEEAAILSTVLESAAETIIAIVDRAPDILLIDVEGVDQELLFGLLRTLKSEIDVARIPVIFVCDTIDGDGILFHLGDHCSDLRKAVEYINELVSIVMRANSYRMTVPDSGNEAPESGILVNN